jgi:hypothetical protein
MPDESKPGFSHWPASRERRILTSVDRFADGLNSKKYLILFLFSTLYLFATCFRASQKLFWYDELITVYLSRLPDMTSVWNATRQGTDFNPPLFFGITRVSESLFGEGHIGTRLPEILGFWILCLCIFRFVSSRTSVLAGTISMLFPLVTVAYYYAYEARPHGIVLGFAGLALVCWQASLRSRRRAWWLIGLFAALLCAILNHTYGVLLLVPLGLAEFARALRLRRIDWAASLAIVASLAGVLPSLLLFRATKVFVPGLAPASFISAVKSYQTIFEPAVIVLVAGLILYFFLRFASPNPSAPPSEAQSLQLPEVIAIVAFSAMPFFAYFLARLTGAPFYFRYGISAVIGVACLFGILAAKKPAVGLCTLALLAAQIGLTLKYAGADTLREPSTNIQLSTRADQFAHRYREMEAAPDKNSPIVLFDDFEFLPTIYYAPPDIASRLVVPRFSQVNFEFYIRLQRFSKVAGRGEIMPDFLASHDNFLVYVNSRTLFQIQRLIDQGADVRVENVSGAWPEDGFLVSVTFKKNRSASAATPPPDRQ